MSSFNAKVIAGCFGIASGLLAACAFADEPGDDHVDRLARSFIGTLSPADIEVFRRSSDSDLPRFHFGAGSRVRHLYFGPGAEGRKTLCRQDDYCDIDRESMRIVERTWEIIQQR